MSYVRWRTLMQACPKSKMAAFRRPFSFRRVLAPVSTSLDRSMRRVPPTPAVRIHIRTRKRVAVLEEERIRRLAAAASSQPEAAAESRLAAVGRSCKWEQADIAAAERIAVAAHTAAVVADKPAAASVAVAEPAVHRTTDRDA